jgi:single-strand DNA-binding protein
MTDETGAKVDYTTSVDVEVERRLAEVCAQFLRKGREVLVMGTLCQSHWIDPKTRKPRSKIKVVSQQIQFLGPPPAPEDSSPEELVDASDE